MSTEELARQMAEALLNVAIHLNLESWERDLTPEEFKLQTKVNAALDNEYGRAAREAMQEALTRSIQES